MLDLHNKSVKWSNKMNSERIFIFHDEFDENEKKYLKVKIPEFINPEYGMYVWPSAPILAQYIWKNKYRIQGKQVLELGAGTALPGVVAAKCGANVTLSDSYKFPDCQKNCEKSCEVNQLTNVSVIGLSWGTFDPNLLQLGPIDIVLASDCFYDTKDFEDVLVTVSYILERNKYCQFWCTYQERSADRNIEYLLKKWRLKCENVPLKYFEADSTDVAGSGLPGNHTIFMFIITKERICS